MQTLANALTRAESVNEALSKTVHEREFGATEKNILLVGYFEIASEHHASIALLIRRGLPGSAFALFRPLYESFNRFWWVNACASESQIRELSQNDNFTFPHDMMKQIDAMCGSQDFFQRNKKRVWASACSYAHGGLLPLSRRFTKDSVQPNYSETSQIEVLDASSMLTLLFAFSCFKALGWTADADHVAKEIEAFDTQARTN